jgi:FMN-dependent NADH-azoreductase
MNISVNHAATPTLLFVTSSLFGEESIAKQVALEFIAAWREVYPRTKILHRDLLVDPLPHLSREAFVARAIPEGELTEKQRELLAVSYNEIAKLLEADVILITAPMYNFSISSILKIWIDHVVVGGRTFSYNEQGRVEGLLKNKRVFVASARGGLYSPNSPAASQDFNETYLRCILGFIGLTDVHFIKAEGQGMGAAAAAAGRARAREVMKKILGECI